MRIILASKSPRRRELLSLLGCKFDIIDTDADETCDFAASPDAVVEGFALRKALAAQKLCGTEAVIISADTVVCAEGKILGKPEDEVHARKMLRMLSDSYHEVYTGYAILQDRHLVLDHCVTRVKMRYISDEEIQNYIETGEPFDKAGGYGIQERGGAFVERIEGNYHNVVGLPLCEVAVHLAADFGIKFN